MYWPGVMCPGHSRITIPSLLLGEYQEGWEQEGVCTVAVRRRCSEEEVYSSEKLVAVAMAARRREIPRNSIILTGLTPTKPGRKFPLCEASLISLVLQKISLPKVHNGPESQMTLPALRADRPLRLHLNEE